MDTSMSFFWTTLEASRISISKGCPLAVRWTMMPSAISRESEGLPSLSLIIKTSASREYLIFIRTSASEIPSSKRKINRDYNWYLILIPIDGSQYMRAVYEYQDKIPVVITVYF